MATLGRVPGAGLLIDETFTITDGNNRCEVVFREGFDRIRGETLRTLETRELFDEPARRRWERAVSAALEDGRETTEQITLRPVGEDTEFVYDLRVFPSDDREGTVCCSLRSVGTRQRYDETLTALHVATRELMAAEDVQGVLRKTAEAANEVLGFPGAGVRRYDEQAGLLRHVAFGARVDNIDSRPPYHVDESPHGRAIQRGETIIDDIDDDDPFDRDVFTQTMYVPIGETGLLSVGVVGSTFDETDVQFAEILAENAAAAIRVAKTTSSLRAERERLDQFASVVSHDLRNPLGIAKGYLGRARETNDPADFDTAQDALDRMDRMIEDLLTMARADVAAAKTETVPLGELAQTAWETARTEDATLDCDATDDTVECSPSLLQNLFENLFRNAVDHNDGSLTVRVGSLEGDAEGFYVADDGQGIPATERDTVFEYGYSTSDSGTGLGLSIVREIATAHDWGVSVTDGSDGGARFEIRTQTQGHSS